MCTHYKQWHGFLNTSPVFIPVNPKKNNSPGPIRRNAYLARRRVKRIQKTHAIHLPPSFGRRGAAPVPIKILAHRN